MSSRVSYVSDPAAIAQTLFDLIESAEESVVFQMYLFAGNYDLCLLLPRPGIFSWADLLADRLIAKKRRAPAVEVVALLDTQTPDNASLTRKGKRPLVRHRLEEAGIAVLNASLFTTRFSPNRRFPRAARFHTWPHDATPQDDWVQRQQAWQTWHNVEDHRKNLVIDRGRCGAVTSHNAIDIASDWHDNLLLVSGEAGAGLWDEVRSSLREALRLPQRLDAAARARVGALASLLPTQRMEPLPRHPVEDRLRALGNPAARPDATEARAEIISSGAIRSRLHQAIDDTRDGEEIAVASTYFADLAIMERLRSAAARGARVRILIDDCHGLPLPPFESWFVRSFVNLRCLLAVALRPHPALELRVHRSGHGPMMHLKTAAFLGRTRFLLGGQANYTPNTFDGAWLDTVVRVEADAPVAAFLAQFEPLWAAARQPRAPGVFGRLQAAVMMALLKVAEWIGFRP